ncbi:hypothetical protein LguiB_007886 [Lonicera macranthoides]
MMMMMSTSLEILNEMFPLCSKTATIVKSIISKCLGLSPTLINQYNNNLYRDRDIMASLFYLPATARRQNRRTYVGTKM